MRAEPMHYWTNPGTGFNDRTACGDRETGYNCLAVTTEADAVTCPLCLCKLARTS